jgi:hypothetical protein
MNLVGNLSVSVKVSRGKYNTRYNVTGQLGELSAWSKRLEAAYPSAQYLTKFHSAIKNDNGTWTIRAWRINNER